MKTKKLIESIKKYKEKNENPDKLQMSVRHLAGLVKKYNELSRKQHNYSQDYFRDNLSKVYLEKTKEIKKEIDKHYGHLKDADGNKLRGNIDYYDTDDHVGFAKTWFKHNKLL
jgi:hypothetical protein